MSRVRQSVACMIAGLMIIGPMVPWFLPWGWEPKPIVAIALVSMVIIGIMIMYDELKDVVRR